MPAWLAAHSAPMSPAETPDLPLVACLCAEWCGSCRDYRAVFGMLQRQFSGRARLIWVDIEDEAEALGAIDIDNFPSLLIADGDAIRFFGAVTPQPQTASRLIERALHGQLRAPADVSADGLPARLRGLLHRVG